jgi:hypothetical protein
MLDYKTSSGYKHRNFHDVHRDRSRIHGDLDGGFFRESSLGVGEFPLIRSWR